MIKYNDIKGDAIENLVNEVFAVGTGVLENNTVKVNAAEDGMETNTFFTACNMVRISADISGEFTTIRVNVKIFRNDGTEELVSITDCVSGRLCCTFDAANFAVYRDAKQFRVHIVSRGDSGFFTVDNLQVCPLEGIQQSAYYEENFNDMMDNVFSAVDSLQSSAGVKLPTLVSPSGKKFTLGVDDDGNIISIPNVPRKTVMLGNSLLLGMQFYGMCASAPDKDYAHYVQQAVWEKNPDATFEKIFAAPFESAETDEMYYNWWNNPSTRGTKKVVKEIFTEDTDLIIIQLTDNVNNTARVNIFEKHAEMLISSIKKLSPKARIIWVMGYYNRANTFGALLKLCRKWSIPIVDISDLNTEENQSKSGSLYMLEDGTQDVVKDGWITHPGDTGMKKIAARIIEAIDM